MNPIKYLASATAALALALSAQALPSVGLTLTTDGVSVFVPINGAGQATFNGSIGTWSINVDTGLSYPALGTQSQPELDLSYDAAGVGTGTNALTINFVDSYGPVTAGGGSISIGGTESGVTDVYSVLENGVSIGSLSESGTPFASVSSGLVTASSPTTTFDQQIVISGSGQTSGDANFTVPDQGMTLVLLALGLTALGLVAWKRSEVHTSA